MYNLGSKLCFTTLKYRKRDKSHQGMCVGMKITLDKKEDIELFFSWLRQNSLPLTVEINQSNGIRTPKPDELAKILVEAWNKNIQSPAQSSKLPTPQELENYILSIPNYEHTIHQVAEHFLGAKLKYDKQKPEVQKQYNKLWIRLDKVRRRIAIKNNGKWTKEKTGEFKFGMPIKYTFIKS
jgi:hypothetical protein